MYLLGVLGCNHWGIDEAAAATSFSVRMQKVGCDKEAYSERTPERERERRDHHSRACSI